MDTSVQTTSTFIVMVMYMLYACYTYYSGNVHCACTYINIMFMYDIEYHNE